MADVLQKPLSLEEKKYLLAVRCGDLTDVRRLIREAYRSQSIDINCVDSLGRSSLDLAIENENLEMVELLIVMGVKLKDALLQAIDAEFVEAVETLLIFEEIIYKEDGYYSWENVDWNTSTFTPDITPLILAAHKNNFEILKILRYRGVDLPEPHCIGCSCYGCVRESKMDSLRHSMSRVNVYRALSSPALMSLFFNDPILTAFELSWKLRMLSREEKEYQSEYTELRYQCQQFAVDLLDETRTLKELVTILNHELDQTRSSEELAIIVNHDSIRPKVKSYITPEFVKLRKLELAIKYRQKRFIAHPHVQQQLTKIWYDGLPGFRSKTLVSQSIAFLQTAIMFPVYCLAFMFAPNSKYGLEITKPVKKFIIHVTSYLLFLGILILESLIPEIQIEDITPYLNKSLRDNSPTILEWVVLIYVVGYIHEEWREIRLLGLKHYLKNSMWNVLEFIKNCTYVMVMVLRLYAYARERFEIQNESSIVFVPRHKWRIFDPQLIAEGLFALANIGSALKLIHIFTINSHLGILQISLGRKVNGIVKFFSIYVLVLLSFACGLHQLLRDFVTVELGTCYSREFITAKDYVDWKKCNKWERLENLFGTIQTLFWTAFGESDLKNFYLLQMNPYTRFCVLMIFGIYCVINVTVMLNLLIAMMSNSYSIIQGQSDMEWKFSVTELWMIRLENMSMLPSPLNLIPYTTIRNLCNGCFGIVCPRLNSLMRNQSTVDLNLSIKPEHLEYTQVMRMLIWRYIAHKHRKSEQTVTTKDHIQEVKSDISSIKYELLNIQRKSGMEVHSEEDKRDRVLSKKLRIWERQLSKHFHVGLIKADESIDTVPVKESEYVFNDIPLHSRQLYCSARISEEVGKAAVLRNKSLIGQCKTEESLIKQKKLMNAMREAQIMVSASPTTSTANMEPYPYTLPPSSFMTHTVEFDKTCLQRGNDGNSSENHDNNKI